MSFGITSQKLGNTSLKDPASMEQLPQIATARQNKYKFMMLLYKVSTAVIKT